MVFLLSFSLSCTFSFSKLNFFNNFSSGFYILLYFLKTFCCYIVNIFHTCLCSRCVYSINIQQHLHLANSCHLYTNITYCLFLFYYFLIFTGNKHSTYNQLLIINFHRDIILLLFPLLLFFTNDL